ncbi:MAG TPA: transglutaminase family protein [Polyangiaceae bacterium]|nr:transglutaminase family protein [Polyangiaceae bacterium]
MLLSICHETVLGYTEPISESVMELRVMPRNDARQTLRSFELDISPEAGLFQYGDWQGNLTHCFSVLEPHEKLVIVASSTVEAHTRKLRVQDVPDTLPLAGIGHRLEDMLLPHQAVERDPRLVQFAEQTGLVTERRASTVLGVVTTRLGELIAYAKGVTSTRSSVSEVLDHGKGVCQDYAHVALALLRILGIPARYVSGYLYRSESAELETHAWVEVFIPSVGWLGLDPTHGELAGDGHVAVAVGRSYADVPPNRGVYRGPAVEHMRVSVRIQKADEPSEAPLLPPPRLAARFFRNRMQRERRVDLHTLEQQQQQQQQ